MKAHINASIFAGIKTGVRLGSNLNLAPPTNLVSSFDVPTISGVLGWTDNSGGTAQYEVYSYFNGGSLTLLGTTVAGATSYVDATCKQNATVVYVIKAKKGTKFSGAVIASDLITPLCLKTNQSVLTQVVINQLTIAVGKSVTVNYGDGTSQAYIGSNTNVTKNYAATGQYNIWLSGDTNSITTFNHSAQIKTLGDIGNWILPSGLISIGFTSTSISGNISDWILPSSLVNFYVDSTSVSGNISSWVLPASLVNFNIRTTTISGNISSWVLPSSTLVFIVNNTLVSGSLPQITTHATNGLVYRTNNAQLSDSNATVFRKAMAEFNTGSQTVAFPTANIDKLLKALADWYQVNAPTANCTFTLSGANMGIPTGGASNIDITRLVGYYTAAGRSCTVLVRTS